MLDSCLDFSVFDKTFESGEAAVFAQFEIFEFTFFHFSMGIGIIPQVIAYAFHL